MNRQMKLVSAVLLVVFVICNVVVANAIEPRADLYFDSASAFLSASKSVVFDFTMYKVHDRIAVTNVWLEQEINGEWEHVKSLTPPSYVAENMADYGAVCYYSSEIGTGTFRIGFTANADGHTITRNSNSRTF